jgi:hypothetical protein
MYNGLKEMALLKTAASGQRVDAFCVTLSGLTVRKVVPVGMCSDYIPYILKANQTVVVPLQNPLQLQKSTQSHNF